MTNPLKQTGATEPLFVMGGWGDGHWSLELLDLLQKYFSGAGEGQFLSIVACSLHPHHPNSFPPHKNLQSSRPELPLGVRCRLVD